MSKYNKNELNKLALKAGTFYLIAEFLIRGVSFLLTPVFTRLVDTAQFGRLNIYDSWMNIIPSVMTLGLAASVTRAKFDYEEDYDTFLSSVLFLSLALSVFFSLFFLIFRPIISDFLELSPFLFFTILIYAPTVIAFGFYKTREIVCLRYWRVITLTMITALPATVGSIILLYFGNRTGQDSYLVELRVLGAYYPFVIVGIIAAFLLLRRGNGLIRPAYWKYALAYSLPLVPETLSIQIMNQSDKFMIQKMIGSVEAGLFSLATTISYIVWIIREAIWSAWQPWMFEKLKQKDEDEIEKYWLLLAGGMSLLVVMLVLVTPELTLLFGGKRYEEAIYLVAPTLLSVLFAFFGYIYRAVQSYELHTEKVALGTVTAMLLNVLLNYMGIRLIGYSAAAYTTAISFLFLMIFQAILEKRTVGRRLISLRKMLLLSTAVSVCSLGAMGLFHVHWLVRWGICMIFGVAVIAGFLRWRGKMILPPSM